jgi:rhomboid protease GluP
MTYPTSDPTQTTAAPLPQQPTIRHKTVKPYVTYVILGITVSIYVLQYIVINLTGRDYLFYLGGKINELILLGQLWRFLTPMLLHGGWLHLAGNMYSLYILGRGMEGEWGHRRFFLLYITAGFCGNVLSFLLSVENSQGASTAILGLIGAEAVFWFQNRKLFKNAMNQLKNIAMVLVINLFIGVVALAKIDNFGHLGGLLGGALFAWFAGPLLNLEGLFPVFDLTDKRNPDQVWVGTGITLLVFSGLAAIKFFLK